MFIKSWMCSVFLVLMSLPLLAQETRWNGFMDINNVYDTKNDINTFTLGQLDLFIVSDITDRISFLTENTFTSSADGHSFRAAVERAIIKYEVNNYLNFLVGKHHSPVSYWNNTYHHGRVLQPTSTRPFLFDYNIFPFHTTGLIVNGDYIGKKNFGYQFMVGNGSLEHDSFRDNDKYKSVSLTTHFYPVEDFKVMFSAYGNKISRGVKNYRDIILANNVTQTLYSLCLAYLPSSVRNFEFLGEWMYVRNKSAFNTNSNNGFYAYIGYEINKLTPYVRFDRIEMDASDPFFVIDNMNASTIGLRYSFSHIANIKTEWMYIDSDINGVNNRILIQFGIGF